MRLHNLSNLVYKRIELALTEEQFLDWERPEQESWLKEHPNSKFAELLHKKKASTLIPTKKPKASKEEKEKQANEKFESLMQSKSPEDQEHFRTALKDGVRIPPAWTNVVYHGKSPKDGIIAQGHDEKRRRQRLEDPAYREKKIVEKHERIQKDLEPIFDSTVKKLRKQAQDPNNPEAQVLYLISQTAFRIGGQGDGKAKTQAYGASTLEGRHVKIDGERVTFDFTGKEGVRQQHTIKDPVIAKMVSGKEDDERLFNTNEDKIRGHWKTLGGYKVHDMRSLIATRIAKKELAKYADSMPTDAKGHKKMQMSIAEVVAKKLGNRPSESLNTYIDRSIFPAIPGDGT